MTIPHINIMEVCHKYDALLFDAFGVLLNAQEALPHAKELITKLNKDKKKYFVLTNGSRSNIKDTAQKYSQKGLNIAEENIVSSGSLIKDWLESQNLLGEKCLVLGPKVSKDFVTESGGCVVENDSTDFKVLIICNQDGFTFPDAIDHAISEVFKKIASGTEVRLLLPNPDIIYPSSKDNFGITTGSIAHIIEKALEIRFPERTDLKFEKLGKPFSPIFEKVHSLTQTKNMVLIGDQLTTDVEGAKNYGIDSVLIGTGLTDIDNLNLPSQIRPTYLMKDLNF